MVIKFSLPHAWCCSCNSSDKHKLRRKVHMNFHMHLDNSHSQQAVAPNTANNVQWVSHWACRMVEIALAQPNTKQYNHDVAPTKTRQHCDALFAACRALAHYVGHCCPVTHNHNQRTCRPLQSISGIPQTWLIVSGVARLKIIIISSLTGNTPNERKCEGWYAD